MKQTIKIIRTITIGLFSLCVVAFTTSAFAGAKNDNPVELKFIGQTKNEVSLRLDLNNSESGEFFVNIKGSHYQSLYSEIMKGVNLSKIINLNIDEADLDASGLKVRVEITSEKTRKTQVYEINSNSGDNIIVAKL